MLRLAVLTPLALILPAASFAQYGNLPMAFEPNVGQTDSPTEYLSVGPRRSVLFTPSGPVLSVLGGGNQPAATLRMTLRGGNRSASLEGQDALSGITNYLVGSDPAKWRTGIPQYRRVSYRSVYPGVDVVFYGDSKKLEFDFLVAPHANPNRIEMEFEGVSGISLDKRGDLLLAFPTAELRQKKPVAYQEVAGSRTEIPCRYLLLGKRTIGFQFAKYDKSQPLVIDPVLVYSTYLPWTDSFGPTLAVDADGNAYRVGNTGFSSLPTTPGAIQSQLKQGTCGVGSGTHPCTDAWVAKINSTGTALIYATYLGGDGDDGASGVAVDAARNVYVTGWSSQGFPTTPEALQGNQGSFVAKLNPTGTAIVYSTAAVGGAVVSVDTRGAVYLLNSHCALNKLNSEGRSLDYSLQLAGKCAGVAADRFGNAYVSGTISDASLVTTPGVLQAVSGGGDDAFIVKVGPSGLPLYATYLGGSGSESTQGVGVDSAGNALVTGYTTSADFPVTPGAFQPSRNSSLGFMNAGFLAKIDSQGQKLLYSTYVYNPGDGFAADADGNGYLTGSVSSDYIVTTRGALQPCFRFLSLAEAFVMKFGPDGRLLYSTYLGGTKADYARAVAVDSAGGIYVSGVTSSSDFPVTEGALRTQGASFQAKIIPVPGPPLVSTCVVNAASLQYGPVSPGEIISIFDAYAGPKDGAAGVVTPDLRWNTNAADTRVLFDGVQAPVLYSQEHQINAVVPYSVAGRPATYLQIEYKGERTNQVPITVSESNPAVFGVVADGQRQAAILNQDATLNTSANPAARGSIVSIYATGEGVTDPPSEDGKLAPLSPPWPKPVNPVEVYMDGKRCEILYAGAAPTLTAGMIQINARIPKDVGHGSDRGFLVNVVLKIGSATGTATLALAR